MPRSAAGNRRQLLRVCYPRGCRARLDCEDASYPVVDLSQQGARVDLVAPEALPVGSRMKAVLQLISGSQMELDVEVLRRSAEEAALRFELARLHFGAILEEHRLLLHSQERSLA